MKETQKEKIIEALDNITCVSKDDDGYYVEIYSDYRDEMSDETIATILNDPDPQNAFYEQLIECYSDYEGDVYCMVKDSVVNYLTNKYNDLSEDLDEDQIYDYIRDIVYCKYPEDHYFNQEVSTNIFVDTGDGNYDFVLNCVYPHYNGRRGEALNTKASIAWLAKQQGYKKSELKDALNNGSENKFLMSVRDEVLNHGSHMATLAFLVKLSLKDLIHLNQLIKLQDINGHKYDATKNPYCGYIVIDKSCMTGLYDCWSGGGSILDIALEKDVKLPIKYIRSALPDGEDGYSVESIYGMCGSAWKKDMIKEIHGPRKIRKGEVAC